MPKAPPPRSPLAGPPLHIGDKHYTRSAEKCRAPTSTRSTRTSAPPRALEHPKRPRRERTHSNGPSRFLDLAQSPSANLTRERSRSRKHSGTTPGRRSDGEAPSSVSIQPRLVARRPEKVP